MFRIAYPTSRYSEIKSNICYTENKQMFAHLFHLWSGFKVVRGNFSWYAASKKRRHLVDFAPQCLADMQRIPAIAHMSSSSSSSLPSYFFFLYLFLSRCSSRRITHEGNGIPRNFFLPPEIPRRRFNGIKKFPRCTSLRPLLPRGAGDSA